MADVDPRPVTDWAGRAGTVRFEQGASGRIGVVRFGEDELTVPADRLVELADGTYRLEEPAEARAGGVVERESVPLVTEEVEVGKRERHTRVQVHKTTETRTERIEVPLHHTMFEVKRIPVDRVLTEPVGTRNEGGTTIIPVMEERVVVSKELVLVEEIHLIPREGVETHTEEVTLRREEASVERTPVSDTDEEP